MAAFFKRLPLQTHFPKSGLTTSALLPIGAGFLVGVLAAFLGVGGGFIMLPAMIYVIGIPTRVAIGTENPPWRRLPSIESTYRLHAGPGEVRDSSRPIAQGGRPRTSRADTARRRISVRHSPSTRGSSISANTRSTAPSRISSLPDTW